MASTKLTKTFSGATTSNKIGTQSLWVKKSSPSSANWFALQTSGASGGGCGMIFETDGTMTVWFAYTGTWQGQLETNKLFRDPNAWYHIVLSYDTTQGTASDRLKLYVNGVQETSFSTATYPAQNTVHTFLEASRTQYIAGDSGGSTLDGCISHFHCIDGTAYDASAFGEYDANGVWKIKTSPSVTYGNNGFFILKDGNSLTDQSGNGNNWTVGGGTLTNTEDNPSNVFATFNPLMHFRQPTPLLYGNTAIENADAQWENGYGTIATPTTGKFYAEFKYPAFGSGGSYGHAGIIAVDDIANQASGYLNFGDASNSWSLSVTDGGVYNSGSSIATYSSISANGIIGMAIDCTNSKLYYSVNGTWQNSANPSAGTGGISITSNKEYFVGGKVYNAYLHANFGNGYFGTTAVASAGTNASGIGIFEYDVPTGYTALSTKGLNL